MSSWKQLVRAAGVLVLALLAACDSKPKAKKAPPLRRAEGSIFLYNSQGSPLKVNVTIGETVNALELDLNPGAAKRLKTEWAQRYSFKVAGLANLNQSLDVPPLGEGRGDVILDLGGQGSFHRWPLFYVPWGKGSTFKIPDEIREKFRPEPLQGPRARYDLDFRASGLNMRPRHYMESHGKPGEGEVYWILVDDARLRDLQEGRDVDIFER